MKFGGGGAYGPPNSQLATMIPKASQGKTASQSSESSEPWNVKVAPLLGPIDVELLQQANRFKRNSQMSSPKTFRHKKQQKTSFASIASNNGISRRRMPDQVQLVCIVYIGWS